MESFKLRVIFYEPPPPLFFLNIQRLRSLLKNGINSTQLSYFPFKNNCQRAKENRDIIIYKKNKEVK